MIYVVNYLTKSNKIIMHMLFKSLDIYSCQEYLANFLKTQQKKLAEYINSAEKLPDGLEYMLYFHENIGWSEYVDSEILNTHLANLRLQGYTIEEKDWTVPVK